MLQYPLDMSLDQLKKSIANAVKSVRKERRLTQRELADLLEITQAWYSQLENGLGSFTAEQLITLCERFNLPMSSFTTKKNSNDTLSRELQNSLVRLGANNLYEDTGTLPSENFTEVNNVIIETLISVDSSRQILALAPVIVKNISSVNINMVGNTLLRLGLINRLGWLLDGIRIAIESSLSHFTPRPKKQTFSRALLELKLICTSIQTKWNLIQDDYLDDFWDKTITTEKTLENVKNTRDELAKKWKIITRITSQDFTNILKETSFDQDLHKKNR